MKNILFSILILFNAIMLGNISGIQSDSTLIKNGLTEISKELSAKIDTGIAKLSVISKSKSADSTNENHTCNNKSLSYSQKLLVMMPAFLFILLVFVTLMGMRSIGFKFKQALYNDEPEEIIKASPTPNDPNATTKTTLLDKNQQPVYYPSTSRMIVFLTGLTTLIVITCFISYYAYCMLKCMPLPPFKDLFEVIMGLGLGIVPYGVNRIAAASKPNT